MGEVRGQLGMLGLLSSRGFGFGFGFKQRPLSIPFTFRFHNLRLSLCSMAFSAASPTSPQPTTKKRIGTHNGSFHCDEALGCFMIRLTDSFSNAEIVRTRDPQVPQPHPFMLEGIRRLFYCFNNIFEFWEERGKVFFFVF